MKMISKFVKLKLATPYQNVRKILIQLFLRNPRNARDELFTVAETS